MHIIQEEDVELVALTGRKHRMAISPWNFGPSERMCFGTGYFPAKSHAPEHVHNEEEEIIYCLSGSGEMFFDDKPEKMKEGSIIFIPPKVRHSIKNDSDEVMKLIYVFSPPVKQGSYEKK